jgi:O-antigen ligase
MPLVGIDAWIRALACTAPLAAATALAFRSGGYFITDWGLASMALLCLLAAVAIAVRDGWAGWAGLTALGAWAGLGAWQGLSALWNDEPAAATRTMDLTLLYAAALGLAIVGVQRTSWLRRITDGALLMAAVVGAYALGTRLLPDVISGDSVSRLSEPIGYWNGLGALLAFGLVLALGAAGHPERRLVSRALAGALVPLFALGLVLTLSRGAVLVAAIGIALVLGFCPGRLETLAVTILTLGASAPLLAYVAGRDDLSATWGTLPPHVASGHRVALMLLLTMLLAGALSLAPVLITRRLPPRLRTAVGIGAVLVVILAALGVSALHPPSGGPIDWADRQWTAFKSFDAAARSNGTIADQLSVAAGSGRWQMWSVAKHEVARNPLIGTGAGDYRFWWREDRPIDLEAQNAHSLPLEVLAESGIVGLLLLLVPIGVAIAVAVRARSVAREARVARDLPLALAAVAVVILHSFGDWDWQLTAVTLPGVALLGAAIKTAVLARDPTPRAARVAPWLVAGASVAALFMVVGPTASATKANEARRLAAADRLPAALSAAREARDLDPQDPSAAQLEAQILDDMGRARDADIAFAEALVRSPSDWSINADWAASLIRRGDEAAARLLIARAKRLAPGEVRVTYLEDALRS